MIAPFPATESVMPRFDFLPRTARLDATTSSLGRAVVDVREASGDRGALGKGGHGVEAGDP